MSKRQPGKSVRTTAASASARPPLGEPERSRLAAPAAAAAASQLKSVCVYCGSGKGKSAAYASAARTLGKALAKDGIELVYGGGSLGLMGEVANAVLKNGGRVTGIIPRFLSNRERMLEAVQELVFTDDMHQRKMEMFRRSDAFVALPGGIGTLEELVEQLTWSQLGRHKKPIVLANIDGFWSPFLALLEHMGQQAFIRPGLEITFSVVTRAQDIVPAVRAAVVTVAEAEPEKVADIERRF